MKPNTFTKGNPGRPKGATNKITKTVKETVLSAFNELQNDKVANLLTWGRNNPDEFYKLAAKLIPTEIAGTGALTVIVDFKDAE